ncbi:MAG: nitrogenase component 1 [Bilifractor sp.]
MNHKSETGYQTEPRYYTAAGLSAAGRDHIPDLYQTGSHLIYSSPATLAYNSPGAEGFGVKRAGLSVPGSVMLIVSPGCCGRNTAEITRIRGCEDRFFYLQMDETDLVTGRHLKKIPAAVRRIAGSLPEKPSVIMICITCADALLGTDLERVCRKAEQEAGLPVRPCYMYALTREGRKPPMVYVRESLYSMLPLRKKKSTSVNLLGFFAPVHPESELFSLLKSAGIRRIRQISTCADADDFYRMGEANFNLVLNPEARGAADELTKRLGIPSIELTRFYETDLTERQYRAFFAALGMSVPETDGAMTKEKADRAGAALRAKYPDLSFSIGEVVNANPFELALALLRMGWRVTEIFANPSPDWYPYIDRTAALCPDIRVYSNTDPSMLGYEIRPAEAGGGIHITIGKDAAYYHPDALHLHFNEDTQPFGYEAAWYLWAELGRLLRENAPSEDRKSPVPHETCVGPQEVSVGPQEASAVSEAFADTGERAALPAAGRDTLSEPLLGTAESASGQVRGAAAELREGRAGSETLSGGSVKGLGMYLTPFAPDQSGAVSALYSLDGMIVILDAGGCTGNILGFDEPRWQHHKAAVFSAGLRDMDAIMGRDRELVQKAASAFDKTGCSFIALVGTPVPSIIGTDYRALERMLEKKCGCPVISIPTDGMKTCESGLELTYLTLFRRFSEKKDRSSTKGVPLNGPEGRKSSPFLPERVSGTAGVIGCTPLELVTLADQERIRGSLTKRGFEKVVFYGADARREDYESAGENARNFVLSGAGIRSAEYLRKTFGTPYEIGYPGVSEYLRELPAGFERAVRTDSAQILILHDPVAAASLKAALLEKFPGSKAGITCASFFAGKSCEEASCSVCGVPVKPDISLREENDLLSLLRDRNYDYIFADPVIAKMPAGEASLIPFPSFAVSGKRILT